MPEVLQKPVRREVRYANLSEFLRDAERLATIRVQTVGNWTYGQILQHLAVAIRGSLDGYGFKAPWFARCVIAPLVKNRLLTKRMPAGIRLPSRAEGLIPPADVSLETSLEELRHELARLGKAERDMAPHPFLGRLASQEWNSLHLRHAELHMSFVVPMESNG